jgi:hypothetical protein
MKNKISFIIVLSFIISLIFFISSSEAVITNTSISVLTEQDYSQIWFGMSTGGYNLISEKNKDYIFSIYVKNGMAKTSLNNVELSSDSEFKINSITPKSVEQLKPLEIRIFIVNMTIPKDIKSGKYPLVFDVSTKEFPVGIFKLNTEIKIVDRIKYELYFIYTFLIILILIILFYRKIKLDKE